MSIYLRPEEIIAEIRRVYPYLPQIPRAEAARLLPSYSNMYGVPIYIYGEGIRGQYLRHSIYTREGRRHWMIEYGWVTIYGRLREGAIIPLVVLGMPTRFVFEHNLREFAQFFVEEVPVDYVECREDQIINLNRVMEGKDPVMIIDKYDLLRKPVPEEMIERVMELHAIIEEQQKAIAQYEAVINDYQTTIRALEARLAKYQELLRSYESRIVKLTTEVTSIQAELIRLRDEMRVRSIESQTAEEVIKTLMDLVDRLLEVLKTMPEAIERVEKIKAGGGGRS